MARRTAPGQRLAGLHRAGHIHGFHTYGVDWEPTTTTFYMDGKELGSAPTPSSMNSPMFMLLNLAVGGAGSWRARPIPRRASPASLQIGRRARLCDGRHHLCRRSAALPAQPSSPAAPAEPFHASSPPCAAANHDDRLGPRRSRPFHRRRRLSG
ncbi:MAG: family 16 glycosylhydrolase [Acetobacteraceae bacterium]